MEVNDTYKTIASASEPVLLKEKSSKFLGYAFPIEHEDEVKDLIEELRKQNSGAGHFCYAYQIGVGHVAYRANDDGEPNNSAGMPIYGQIQSFDVTNVLIVVVRYFGGTKLGVGGLITAYKTVAQMSLEQSKIIEKTIDVHFLVSFEYVNMNKVMRVIKEKNLEIVAQILELTCEIEIKTRKKNAEHIFDIFSALYPVEVKIKE
ncbi:IMPACT family protein [Flavobacterium sp. SM2513]|uniref:IMPACT family protein n=1 Tax=Flavobacterium sp. SM2513 TaxID=3424766 RepID=UPI003D7F5E66